MKNKTSFISGAMIFPQMTEQLKKLSMDDNYRMQVACYGRQWVENHFLRNVINRNFIPLTGL